MGAVFGIGSAFGARCRLYVPHQGAYEKTAFMDVEFLCGYSLGILFLLLPLVVGGTAVAIFILNREGLSFGKSIAYAWLTAVLDNLFFVPDSTKAFN